MTILERLRAATGPDRKLDVRIGYETDLPLPDVDFTFREHIASHNDNYAAVALEADRHASMFYTALPRYTASIDAALALVERMLPGCGYTVTRGRFSLDEPLFSAQICRSDLIPDDAGPEPYGFPSGHNSPALAILAALFAAIEAKEKK